MNMLHEPQADPEELYIDKRIVKAEYRNFDLVARYWEYGYLGKIWKNRRAVEEVDAVDDEGIDELVSRMKGMIDEWFSAKQTARGNQPPDAQELTAALREIQPKLSMLERLLLKQHADCPKGEFELDKLQRLTGYSSAAPALMNYSGIAQRLCDEIGYQPRDAAETFPCLSVLLKPVAKEPRMLVLKKDALKAVSSLDW